MNLNSGFWNIQQPQSADDWLSLFRAVLPFAVLPVATLLLMHRRTSSAQRFNPSSLLFVYGVSASVATLFSPEPVYSGYWSIVFLATILAGWVFVDRLNPILSARLLLYVTWLATFIVAAILCYKTGGVVFGDASSAYGIYGDLNGLSRSSGVARWAAVPGLVCVVRAFHTRRPLLISIYVGIGATAFYIVYRMQSRGAVFGSVAALLFILLMSSRMRRYALPFAIVALVTVTLVETPEVVSNSVATYLERGQSRQEFVSMTGRTRAYDHGITAFEEAPIFGRGQWADRLTIGEHVHNSYLQALLNGGILGAVPYCASWIAGWLLFIRLQKRRSRLAPQDRLSLLECGAVMMFFTIRAIPETTTASFAVDLLVMVAVYVYLETLSIVSRKAIMTRRPILRPNLAWTDIAVPAGVERGVTSILLSEL